jgi:hypothetical protein
VPRRDAAQIAPTPEDLLKLYTEQPQLGWVPRCGAGRLGDKGQLGTQQ